MIMENLGLAASFLGVYMSLWFILAWAKGRNDLADQAWGLGFVGVAILSMLVNGAFGPSNLAVTAAVTAWGTRLFIHIHARHRGKPEDFRYVQMRAAWGRMAPLYSFLKVFLLQGVLLLAVATPVWFLNSENRDGLPGLAVLGLAIWAVGFLFEAVGDWQLGRFISDPANAGRIMTRGLWRYTRHPNYFGEVTQWWGLYLVALAFGGWWTVIGPLTISFLILKVSGIPMLERKYDANPEFQAYKKSTSAFFPLPPKS